MKCSDLVKPVTLYLVSNRRVDKVAKVSVKKVHNIPHCYEVGLCSSIVRHFAKRPTHLGSKVVHITPELRVIEIPPVE